MGFLNDAIASLLALYYQLIPSYGFAIIMLTLTVMVVLTPLTLKGTRSMMAMQRMQPEMKKIQNQYRDDREKLNEELLKFYKENDINPVGGCLPLVVQLPVFLVLYQVLRGLTRRASDLGTASGWAAGLLGKGATPTAVPKGLLERTFDPAFVKSTTDLYHSLSTSTQMNFLGIDLAESASQALKEGFVTALPYLVLIGIVGFSGWYQQRQIQGRNTGQVSSQQQMIARIMPIMLPVISFTLPAGLVVYFAVSNLYRVGQQAWITRTLYDGKDPIPLPSTEDESGNGSGPASRLSEKKGRATPKRDGSVAGDKKDRKSQKKDVTPKASTKKPDAKTAGRSASAKSRSAKSKKVFTSDPKAKKGKGAPPAQVEPRGRKGKKG